MPSLLLPASRLFFLAWILSSTLSAQETQQKTPSSDDTSAGAIVTTTPETPAELMKRCWQMLDDSLNDTKNIDKRELALGSLAEMRGNARAAGMVTRAMKDPDMDVRSSAVSAAGKLKSPAMVRPLHELLNDTEPQVVFISATTLWEDFHDRTGEDILAAVAAGDRKANPSLMHGAEHSMSRTMHSPSAMTKLGLHTGASLLLGPFGFSVTALEYVQKNGAGTARVQAIRLLAEEKNAAVRDEFVDALDDKDPGVRAAAATQLGAYHWHIYAAKIAPLLDDDKLPVRLAAAAAYINCMGPSTSGR